MAAVVELDGGTPSLTHVMDATFRLMIEAAVDYAVFMIDPTGHVVTWNPGAERIKGYEAAEILGSHLSTFYSEEEVKRGLPSMELLTAAREGFAQAEGWRVRKDGSRLWVQSTITAVRSPDGALLGFCKVIRDLTERRLADRERDTLAATLSSTLAHLRSITDSLEDGILEVDQAWSIRFGNPSAFSRLRDFDLGKNLWECFPHLLNTPVEEHLRQSMRQRSSAEYENFYEPYGTWFRVRVTPTELGIAICFTDITRQKQLEQKLESEAISRVKKVEGLSHMAAGLAHEISNPLAIIHATASELSMELEGAPGDISAAWIRYANSIMHMSDRASRILRGLRGFAREAQNDPMELASVHQILTECADMQQSRFDRNRIELQIEVADDLPNLYCRETQIGQIVTNLINNAFDAVTQDTSSKPWVRIEAEQRDGNVVIAVSDGGPGIADHFRDHIMDAFFTTKNKGLGMGIGLSLSRTIAEDHGGSLRLMPGGPPTRIELTLPADEGNTDAHRPQTKDNLHA